MWPCVDSALLSPATSLKHSFVSWTAGVLPRQWRRSMAAVFRASLLFSSLVTGVNTFFWWFTPDREATPISSAAEWKARAPSGANTVPGPMAPTRGPRTSSRDSGPPEPRFAEECLAFKALA
eukprot:1631288-Pyramimonas_sp.AAC.1